MGTPKRGRGYPDVVERFQSLELEGAGKEAVNQLFHELQVHQEELSAQNHQLIETQHALEESRDRYVNLYDFAPIGYMTINASTYVHDMLRVSGGDNVFGGLAVRYPEVTLDDVARARPDVILLPDEPYRFRAPHAADLQAHPDVPAVHIDLIDRPTERPWGAGEPTAAVVPSAIANAIYDAVGVRVRSVPFTREKVLAALRSA